MVNPHFLDAEREAFESFVRTELGDVPVMDEGRYISPKIQNYWLLWSHASDRTSKLMNLATAVKSIEAEAIKPYAERLAVLEAEVQMLRRGPAVELSDSGSGMNKP